MLPDVTPPQYMIDMAIANSIQSPCSSKRGAVVYIVNRSVVMGSGYNTIPHPFVCTQDAACKATCSQRAVHAEQYALIEALSSVDEYRIDEADMIHVKTVEGVLVPSGEPSCLQCSKLMLAAGLSGMWLYHETGWERYTIEDFHRKTLEYCDRHV